MFENLDVLRMAGGLARHAAAREVEIAKNVANADTPGYRAQDLAPFDDAYADAGMVLRTTRPQHLAGGTADLHEVDAPDAMSPNGNTVSLEEQMVKSAEVRQSHDVALTVYSTALSILRTAIGHR